MEFFLEMDFFEKKGGPCRKVENFWGNFLRATVRPNKAPLSLKKWGGGVTR